MPRVRYRDVQDRLKRRAGVIKALAHPVRLFLLEELSRGERCVCQLRERVELDVSTVSKHLSVLRAAGLVADDKRGAWVFYRLSGPRVAELLLAVGCSPAEEAVAEESR